jgi:ATP-dependent DNA helicase RecG
VQVRLFGKVLDENYTQLLIDKTDLDLMDVVALDKVQKGRRLTDDEFKLLKSQNLVEGRRPNLYVSARVAEVTGEKARYIRNRALDKQHYKGMILAFLQQYKRATRKEIDDLLMDKISDALDKKQKRNRVGYLLYEMSHKDKSIIAIGPRKSAQWRLHNEKEFISN